MPFLIQNKLHWHIYRLLRGRTVSVKLPKIPLYGPSLIHQLQLLGFQEHPQSRDLLTPFSTSGTENSVSETNLESKGGDKGVYHFLGQKLANTCSFVGGRIIAQQEEK
jgi:hypothetical protein